MAKGPGLADRNVIHQTAIHQSTLADFYRRQNPGHRHTGPHGLGETPLSENDTLAGADIGGHDGEWKPEIFDSTLALAVIDQ